jgi:NAD(P)-dependent dehydrogenase (short-subunit alcohol dehydrogenase family)
MSEPLLGRIVAIIGQGSAVDRALAVACAEAGADLALATVARTREQEFEMNSIANEAWSLDRDQFVTPLDSADAPSVQAFAEQTWDRYGRCDVVFAAHHQPNSAPLDELSPDEWEQTLSVNLTSPFLAAHAFGVLMDRAGGGTIVFVVPPADGDASYVAARAGLQALASALEDGWGDRGIQVRVIEPSSPDSLKGTVLAIAESLTPR